MAGHRLTSETEPKGFVKDLWDDGMWVGPRSLRFFLRVNRFFVGWWLFILTFMALGFWLNIGGGSPFWVALPLALLTGAAVTLAVMFLFSRGWVGDGD